MASKTVLVHSGVHKKVVVFSGDLEASSLGDIFPASFSRAVANASEIRGSGVERGVGRCVINRRDSGQGYHQGCDHRGNFKPVIVSRYCIKNRQIGRFENDS